MQSRQLCALLIAGCVGNAFVAAPADAQGQAERRRDTSREQMRFQSMDRDRDGVITRAEWRGDLQSFRQHDRNNDGVLSGQEVWTDATQGNDLSAAFARTDRNGDRLISRDEWAGDLQTFERVDSNDDGRISLSEFLGDDVVGTSGNRPRFNELDANRNGVVTANEWTGSRADFRAIDADGDGVVTRAEYRDASANAAPTDDDRLANRSEAYRAGYNRGMTEGRQAGYEDKNVNGGRWDLDGQRELEQADSGYTSQLGSRSEYQAGYRAGFRRGYALGFGPRLDN